MRRRRRIRRRRARPGPRDGRADDRELGELDLDRAALAGDRDGRTGDREFDLDRATAALATSSTRAARRPRW